MSDDCLGRPIWSGPGHRWRASQLAHYRLCGRSGHEPCTRDVFQQGQDRHCWARCRCVLILAQTAATQDAQRHQFVGGARRRLRCPMGANRTIAPRSGFRGQAVCHGETFAIPGNRRRRRSGSSARVGLQIGWSYTWGCYVPKEYRNMKKKAAAKKSPATADKKAMVVMCTGERPMHEVAHDLKSAG